MRHSSRLIGFVAALGASSCLTFSIVHWSRSDAHGVQGSTNLADEIAIQPGAMQTIRADDPLPPDAPSVVPLKGTYLRDLFHADNGTIYYVIVWGAWRVTSVDAIVPLLALGSKYRSQGVHTVAVSSDLKTVKQIAVLRRYMHRLHVDHDTYIIDAPFELHFTELASAGEKVSNHLASAITRFMNEIGSAFNGDSVVRAQKELKDRGISDEQRSRQSGFPYVLLTDRHGKIVYEHRNPNSAEVQSQLTALTGSRRKRQ